MFGGFLTLLQIMTGVDHPSVTVDERGMLHVVWVRTSLPDYGPPQGVYYAQSTNNGKTWSEARILTDGAYDWPQLATTLAGQIIVIWQDLTRYVSQYRVSDNYGQTWGYVSQIRGLEADERPHNPEQRQYGWRASSGARYRNCVRR
jgi:hypothetical protein